MTRTCLSTQHDNPKGVKIASIWNFSYKFIATELDCVSLTNQAITQKYMCLLSYADNKNAVAQIGDENREGGYTIFPRKWKAKTNTLRYLQMNYRSL